MAFHFFLRDSIASDGFGTRLRPEGVFNCHSSKFLQAVLTFFAGAESDTLPEIECRRCLVRVLDKQDDFGNTTSFDTNFLPLSFQPTECASECHCQTVALSNPCHVLCYRGFNIAYIAIYVPWKQHNDYLPDFVNETKALVFFDRPLVLLNTHDYIKAKHQYRWCQFQHQPVGFDLCVTCSARRENLVTRQRVRYYLFSQGVRRKKKARL